MYTCRECEQPVNQATEVCPYCGADLSRAEVESEPAKGSTVGKRILIWGAMILCVWAFLWFILPERSLNVAASAESSGLEAIDATLRELRAHLEAQGSYPATLDGLTREAFAKVREAAQRAQREGYRLEYTPGPAAEGGNIRTFALVARPGHHGYRGFFVDETGVVRSTTENRAATAHDEPLERR